ncbi:hypothetical protein [Roseomonas chloroacetimidivorans]|uniref:hypothetical protein n=1 Tax=Roseomonas chloroacetimidivorans TaxID=1766656 RepID=UPI003C75692F
MRAAKSGTAAPSIDLSSYPVNVTRQRGAELVTHHFFPVSHRTLERWPITGKVVGGRMVFRTADLFAIAQQKMDEAPLVRSGSAKSSS